MSHHKNATTGAAGLTAIFLHIPRTGGTTLDQIISRNYRQHEIYATGNVGDDGVVAFSQMSPAQKARIKLIKGHMAYGLHESVPGPSAYFTFLRDPIERAISHFHFVRRMPEHPAHRFIVGENLDIESTLERHLDFMLFNAQVRMLSGAWHDPRPGQCTVDHLRLAQKRLQEDIAVIGLTEEFDASLLLLSKALGWKALYYARRNVTVGRPEKKALPPQTLAALTEANKLDLELFQYAQTLFAQRVAGNQSLAEEVARFRRKNEMLQPFLEAYWRLRQYSLRTKIRQAFR